MFIETAIARGNAQAAYPDPSSWVFDMFPQANAAEKSFGDLLAKRMAVFERLISKLGETNLEDGLRQIAVGQEIRRMERDIRSALETILDKKRVLEPVEALWEGDNYSGVHSVDVAIASLFLGASSYYRGNMDGLVDVGIAGLFHDVGKGKNIELFSKKGYFTDDEREEMKKHPVYSVNTIKNALRGMPADRKTAIMMYVLEHHENWDGTGYPLGLKGSRISHGGQILRLTDSLEAGTSLARSARYNGTAKTKEGIMADIKSKSGMFYSPYLVGRLEQGYQGYVARHQVLRKVS